MTSFLVASVARDVQNYAKHDEIVVINQPKMPLVGFSCFIFLLNYIWW